MPQNNEAPGAEIAAPWLRSQMERHKVKVGDIIRETGANKANVSAWVNGLRPMSATTKAMFKFYFRVKELELCN